MDRKLRNASTFLLGKFVTASPCIAIVRVMAMGTGNSEEVSKMIAEQAFANIKVGSFHGSFTYKTGQKGSHSISPLAGRASQ